MKKILLIIAVIFACLPAFGGSYTVESVPNVHLQNRTLYVTNPDGIISAEAEARINNTIAGVWDSTRSEMVVVALDAISGYDVNQFATKLFEAWGIGKKDTDNGLLMLIVMDERQVVIRTGRGMEGVLPDVICGRIIRDVIVPEFREGNYDAGIERAVDIMAGAITNPEAARELYSKYGNDSAAKAEEDFTLDDMLRFMASLGAGAAVIMLLIVISAMFTSRGQEPQERWRKLNSLKPVALFLCFFGLGIPLIAYIPLVMMMRRIRSRHISCPNCGHKMRKLSEEADNAYLPPAQDMEERLNSIDYDVWLCNNCGETDIIPYVNRSSSYTECPVCHARACSLSSDRIVASPTPTRAGRGVRTYTCRNCHNASQVAYEIPKVVVAPIIIGGGGGRGGGGGFSGGSFGGGMTSGGGASGGW